MVLIALAVGGRRYWAYWREHRFDTEIMAAGKRYGIDPALVKAIIWRESNFDPWVTGKAGEIGLMQLLKPAALEWASAEHLQGFTHQDCFQPGTNILAGTWYLSRMLKHYARADDPVPYALADYNAGHTHAVTWQQGAAGTNSDRFITQIGFPSTQRYVLAILSRRELYRREMKEPD